MNGRILRSRESGAMMVETRRARGIETEIERKKIGKIAESELKYRRNLISYTALAAHRIVRSDL
jgi:hypothetical protein